MSRGGLYGSNWCGLKSACGWEAIRVSSSSIIDDKTCLREEKRNIKRS